MAAQFEDFGVDVGDDVIGAGAVEDADDQVRDLAHLVGPHAAGREGGGADAQSAGLAGGAFVEWYQVLVDDRKGILKSTMEKNKFASFSGGHESTSAIQCEII